jgi:inner membrane protein
MSGSLSDSTLQDEMAVEPGVDKHIGRPVLFLPISDPAGIRSLDGIQIDGTKLPVSPASENGLSGIAAELPMAGAGNSLPKHFSIDFTVSGTERLQWLPLADSTTVKLASTWPDPSFSGAFAPQRPDVTPRGFTADWHQPGLSAALDG